jgi:GNAT superfamily N-acetyltransferase
MEIVEVTDERGELARPEWLRRAEGVHRQLRPHLPPEYEAKMRRVFAGGGRMCVAVEGVAVAGVAVYRTNENTMYGMHLYVDDLVTDERLRSKGIGGKLLGHLERKARSGGLGNLVLDSGTQRRLAHRFYFREGMLATAFHFVKKLA